ncbi:MAG: hypothetical protein KC983_07045, partial [Phycisphaerales bacterium]|nr:hypothetical protein [Phycisphaerales bacterium]
LNRGCIELMTGRSMHGLHPKGLTDLDAHNDATRIYDGAVKGSMNYLRAHNDNMKHDHDGLRSIVTTHSHYLNAIYKSFEDKGIYPRPNDSSGARVVSQ